MHPAGLPDRDLTCQRATKQWVLKGSESKPSKHLLQLWSGINYQPRLIFRIDGDWPGYPFLEVLVHLRRPVHQFVQSDPPNRKTSDFQHAAQTNRGESSRYQVSQDLCADSQETTSIDQNERQPKS